MSDESVPRDIAEQTTKNLALLGRFLREALNEPALLDRIPDDSMVVLMPSDDPEFARRNLGLITRAMESGKNVVIQRVGVPLLDIPAWRANERTTIETKMLSPRWPAVVAPEPGDLVIVYDRDRDILLVDFFGLRRQGMGVPITAEAAARVDIDVQEVVGYLLVGFLDRVVLAAPHLTSLLRIAEFRAVTIDELGGLVPPPVSKPGPGTERETAESLANEFSRLIA
ncbi:MAG TPA: DUF5647 family protein [Thermomicrobiales bacterium]|jgi:hypothetical protein